MDIKDKAFLEKLMATFKIEAGEHIAKISSGLLDLEKEPSVGSSDIIETIFREAHSMKGAARAVNREDIESWCQKLESVFAFFKKKKIMPPKETLDLLHSAVDFLGRLVEPDASIPSSSENAVLSDLTRKLDSVLSSVEDKPAGIEAKTRSKDAGSATVAFLPPVPVAVNGFDRGKTTAPEIVRIEKAKLDSLLLKAEEMLSVKPAASQRCFELGESIRDITLLRKQWAEIRGNVRESMKLDEKERGPKDNARKGSKTTSMAEILTVCDDSIKMLHSKLTGLGKSLEQDRRSLGGMLDELLDEAKNGAMAPFSSLLDLFPKMVHDLSHSQSKEASLVVRGGEIEIDRRILEEIKDPLIHLVRNCIDHGIEAPEERVLKGKKRSGTITIAISHESGENVHLSVSDDGSGIDGSAVRRSAIKAGVLPAAHADALEESRIIPLIFESGVSTSPIITEMSGRGLGLAIVQEKVEKLRGTVSCKSSAGSGTFFTIALPLSLAAFRGVQVSAGDGHFVIPTAYIERAIRVHKDEIKTVENVKTIVHKGRAIPFISLSELLQLPRKAQGENKKEFVQVMVLTWTEKYIAIGVDDITGEQEVTVKSLGSQLRRVRNVSGATVLGTGKVVPILSVPDLMKTAMKFSISAAAPQVGGGAIDKRKSVLVVEDSITARTLLKNILEAAGYETRTAVDGVDAFTALRSLDFDLVVSDVDMPRMNGFDLTSKIRGDKKFSELPVVLVTALQSQEDRERGIDVGANAYIVKSSFDQSNLLEVIGRLI